MGGGVNGLGALQFGVGTGLHSIQIMQREYARTYSDMTQAFYASPLVPFAGPPDWITPQVYNPVSANSQAQRQGALLPSAIAKK